LALTDVLLDNESYFTCNSDNDTYCINESGNDWDGVGGDDFVGKEDGKVLHFVFKLIEDNVLLM
jgi:hypothetical protein